MLVLNVINGERFINLIYRELLGIGMIFFIGLIMGFFVFILMILLRLKSVLKSVLLLIRNICRGKNKILLKCRKIIFSNFFLYEFLGRF